MKTSEAGINFICSKEGLRLKAYKAVPTEKYYTIGYGHYSSDVKPNDTITKEKAVELLKKDLARFEANVNYYNQFYKWTQNEFDAMVSFAFNLGSINQLTANGRRDKATIATKMLLYVKSGGKTIKGLVTRRKQEREIFLHGKY